MPVDKTKRFVYNFYKVLRNGSVTIHTESEFLSAGKFF